MEAKISNGVGNGVGPWTPARFYWDRRVGWDNIYREPAKNKKQVEKNAAMAAWTSLKQSYVGVVAIKVTFSNGYLNVVQSAFVNLFNNQHSAGKARLSFLRSMESESIDKESRISSFLEIAVGASGVTAIECLQATSWKLDEAILLFFAVNEADATAPPSYSALAENANSRPDQNLVTGGQDGGYEVCVPPHAKDLFYNDASTTDTSHDILASLYRPPFHVMFNGSFEKAKDAALAQDKWLLVNLQSTKEFSSLMLNRDTWGNEAVSQIISVNFIFWQEYDDTSEGRKVCSFYNMDSIPAVLVIDPITGQKICSWCGMINPQPLGEVFASYVYHSSMETIKDTIGVSPSDADVTSAAKEATSTTQGTAYPALPEEPNVDGKLMSGSVLIV
ncbi:Plant UBX domain-containing protein 7 [Citrus sinensis]|uniref:Plant UBX domain-containing protein 7 n=1 Tax=Citrus sinensis TaxID=2711 RepID=A0ACB8JRG0_CITSI|nr:Plant UBX domain-containing protein 7 [Citrus sinensis]